MAQIVTLIKFKVKITQFQKKGYSSHYKGIVLIIKRSREIQKSVFIFGKELPIYKLAKLQTTA